RPRRRILDLQVRRELLAQRRVEPGIRLLDLLRLRPQLLLRGGVRGIADERLRERVAGEPGELLAARLEAERDPLVALAVLQRLGFPPERAVRIRVLDDLLHRLRRELLDPERD